MRSVGVEEELLVVDPSSGRPVPAAEAMLNRHNATEAAHRPRSGTRPPGSLEGELQLEQVEINTSPHTELRDLEQELRAWRSVAAGAAQECGVAVAALGTSPVPGWPHRSHGERYDWLAHRFGALAREQLINGCHVHVSITSADEGVGVLDELRVWLPVLTALTANSPFWQGADSGYASYRTEAWARWPSAGPSEIFGCAAAYTARMKNMLTAGAALDERMTYLDARLSSRYPTVEIRVADVCMHLEDTILLAALCRGLVDTAAGRWSAGEAPPDAGVAALRLASWQAAREGLDGELLGPFDDLPAPAGAVVETLLDHVRPALAATGDLALVEDRLERLLGRGTGATRQRRVHRDTGDLAAVVTDARHITASS